MSEKTTGQHTTVTLGPMPSSGLCEYCMPAQLQTQEFYYIIHTASGKDVNKWRSVHKLENTTVKSKKVRPQKVPIDAGTGLAKDLLCIQRTQL